MATVHFIQQGKGGVGKSMIASILYQVLLLLGKKVAAFDTDPVNATLAGFKEFEVTCLDILKNGDIDPRQFDTLIDTIMEQKPETHVIVDNGASSFLALNGYIKENSIIGMLEEGGHAVFFSFGHHGRAGHWRYGSRPAFPGPRLSDNAHCGLAESLFRGNRHGWPPL